MGRTSASLLTGGGGFDIGAKVAGFRSLWGVEIEPAIADYAELNTGMSVIRQDVATVDYTALERPWHLHASPVCKNASVAKQGGECEEDIAMAGGIIRAIEALQPVMFTLENVWGYREFQAFKNIVACLTANAYAVDWWHLNAANYGVPQTRKRLILIARRDGKPVRKPMATHGKRGGQPTLFETVKPWIGWYEAIEDLLPTLPDSEFAPWQLERLPDDIISSVLVPGGNNSFPLPDGKSPAFTIGISQGKNTRAFLLGQGERSQPKPGQQPADTVTSNGNQTGVKAFLIPGDNASNGVIRQAGEPMVTVQTRPPERCPHRAFIVNCANGSHKSDGSRGLQIRPENEPTFTVTDGNDKTRAWLSQGRVVSMTPRALARFQSVPDWYELPESRSLACTIIGNMVPPLLARRILDNA